MTIADCVVGIAGGVSSLAAAVLWLYASVLKVPDNIDTFIGELRRISKWNAHAAMAAGVAAFCSVYAFAKQVHWL
jgi:hypothetical protein